MTIDTTAPPDGVTANPKDARPTAVAVSREQSLLRHIQSTYGSRCVHIEVLRATLQRDDLDLLIERLRTSGQLERNGQGYITTGGPPNSYVAPPLPCTNAVLAQRILAYATPHAMQADTITERLLHTRDHRSVHRVRRLLYELLRLHPTCVSRTTQGRWNIRPDGTPAPAAVPEPAPVEPPAPEPVVSKNPARTDEELIERLGKDGRRNLGLRSIAEFLYGRASDDTISAARTRVERLLKTGALRVAASGPNTNPIYTAIPEASADTPLEGEALATQRHQQILDALAGGPKNIVELSLRLYGHRYAHGALYPRLKELRAKRLIHYTTNDTYALPGAVEHASPNGPTTVAVDSGATPPPRLDPPRDPATLARMVKHLRTLPRELTVGELADTWTAELLEALTHPTE